MALFVDIEKKLEHSRLRMKFEAGQGVLALLGASGCGKSMTLKCIAGIERPDRGIIVLDGRTLFDSEKGICLSPQQRRTGYLFQECALFPNMTVRQNIACGVRKEETANTAYQTIESVRKEEADKGTNASPALRQGFLPLRGFLRRRKESGEPGHPVSRKEAAVREIIRAMHLEGLENRKPAQLSGGERQRVALARILVNGPDVLLLDEPFSALDSQLRFQMELEVRDIIRRFGKTVLLVSHDRDEVFRLASRIAIMKDGHLEAVGEKHAVFAAPQTVNGARMTGCKNISSAEITGAGHVLATDWSLPLSVPGCPAGITHVGIRMHDIRLTDDPSGENTFVCQVVGETENPFSVTVFLMPVQDSPSAGVPQPPRRPAGSSTDRYESVRLLGMELPKEVWAAHRSSRVNACLPPGALLLLRDGTDEGA